MMSFDELLKILDRPRIDRDIAYDIGKLSPGITYDDAYRLQLASKKRRVAEGDRIVGHQASFTSPSVRKIYPDFPAPMIGTLLHSFLRDDGAAVDLNSESGITYIENEVGVLMKRDLEGPGVTPIQALAAIEAFFPAIEIAPVPPGGIEGKWTHFHTIAKQKAAGGYIICSPRLTSARSGIDIRTEGVIVSINGEARGSGAAVESMGSPVNVVAAVANRLGMYGERLLAGHIVMTGSISGPAQAVKGDRDALVEFSRLGKVSVRFEA
jgi:2-keto-4-pentenoate hydratase